MRKLETRDVFTMARIVTKTNIREEIKNLVASPKVTDEEDMKQFKLNLGVDFFLALVTNCSSPAVEKDLYSFIADVLEDDVENIIHGDPMELIDRLTKDEGATQWTDFFTKLYRLIVGA